MHCTRAGRSKAILLRGITPPVLAATLFVAGCANPVLRVNAPGYSLELSKAPAAEPRSMDEALQKLNHFRAIYYEAVRSQVGQAQDATTGLVWLGTVIAGLAASDLHRDAILGTALIGGTTYGLARTQIDARRLDVWVNGMEALDCAREASLPLDMDSSRRQQLGEALAELGTQRLAMQEALQAVRDAIAPLARFADKIKPAKAIVAKASTALAEADQTQAAAIGLLEAARGHELSAAVDRVHTGVTKAVKDVTIDPKSIKPLIAGLGGFAQVFAPNSGIESGLASAFGTFKMTLDGPGNQGAGPDMGPLEAAIEILTEQARLLAQAQERTRGLLKEVDLAQVVSALKKCGVKGVIVAMTLEPSTLSFNGPGNKGFEIKGGTPPYQVRSLGLLPEYITPVYAGGLADVAEVKVATGAPDGEYHIRVTDSSPAMQSQQLVVTVAGLAAKVDPADGGKMTTDADWNALLAALKVPGYAIKIGSSTFKVSEAIRSSNGLEVKLNCAPEPNPKPKVQDVRERLAAAEPDAKSRLQHAGALDRDATQIGVSSNPACVAD